MRRRHRALGSVDGAGKGESLFRQLLDAAPDATVGVDRSGRIAFVNAQAERLFGHRREELLGRPIEVLVPERLAGKHRALREVYFADATHRAMGEGQQLTARRRDGSEFPAEISLSCLRTGSGIIVSAAVRDISERLRIEAERVRLGEEAERTRLQAQLQRTQRLESLGQLAGGIAHDFNNLLAVVHNYAAFIAEAAQEHDGEGWAAIAHDAQQIVRAGRRGAELTHQLLAFARKDVARPTVLDVNAVVLGVEDMLRRSIGEHIPLTVHLSDDIGRVLADAGQLEQVLVNLAVNARDAMPGGGTLALDTGAVVVGPDYATRGPRPPPGEYVRLRVSDTGTGMPPEVVERAFEPFYTTKPPGHGTGLGLAMVYGIVTSAGGFIDIYTESGMGTTINVLLPVTDQCPATTLPTAEPAQARGDGETVLLVEDEPALRQVCERMLRNGGYNVLHAIHPAAALEMAQHHPGHIDLLLTDVIMPQMLGTVLADHVKRVRPATPVLYMSGYATPVLAAQGALNQDTVLLEKPFTRAELLAAVHNCLHS